MSQGAFNRRVYVIGIIVVGIAFTYVYKMFELHFSDRVSVGAGRRANVRRGTITDQHGAILAVSIEKHSLFANPEEIADPAEAAAFLAPVLGLPRDFLQARLMRKKRFVWLKRMLEDDVAEAVRRRALKGLHLKREYDRVYPHGTLAATVIGFADREGRGLEGIEYRFDRELAGARRARGIPGVRAEAPPLCDISLTLSRPVQHAAEEALADACRAARAKQGSALVIEARTGRILAMAKYPLFDPNAYAQADDDERRNFSIVDSFEPGSTLKVFAMAALLEHHPAVLKASYRCEGYVEIADVLINCTRIHGRLDADGVIAHSCNAGMIQAMKPLTREHLHDLLARVGFGRAVGADMPGESEGLLRPVAGWSGLSKYSISLGQEISVTSLQLAAAFCALANDGTYVVPSVIESVTDADGVPVRRFYTRTRGQVIRPDIARRLVSMMRGAVSEGTGARARLAQYQVAGKTGTAQKSSKQGGYAPNKYIVSFAGIAPAERPDLCVLVVIDEPAGEFSGGDLAAPVFAGIVRRALPLRGVKAALVPAAEPRASVFAPPRLPIAVMPDLRGMSLSEALWVLVELQNRYGATFAITGGGTVHAQEPAANTALSGKERITLFLK
ncbi:MAG TPA: penicillin-binding protein [Spirochaetota bacterium]|nr:penicillin-binding protein [Spirochaetota bacterium]HOS38513.1 penicillin-binding protein [Spirochaetota bacterium]